MSPRPFHVEALLGLLVGAATWLGIRLAQELEDPYSDARLGVAGLVDRFRRGGETE